MDITMEKNTVNILHLSDLHFGMEEAKKLTETASAGREITLKALIKLFEHIESEWKPDIVVISGDIAWSGKEAEYVKAEKFLNDLLLKLQLKSDKLIIVPGNHDLDRQKAVGLLQPKDSKEADVFLDIPACKKYMPPFDDYIKFTSKLGLIPFTIGNGEYTLMGQREIHGIKFNALNSAWFCRDNDDKGKLYIGLPHFILMDARGQLIDYSQKNEGPITITVMHHPKEDLDYAENHTVSLRQITWYYVTSRSNIILSGHTHDQESIDPQIESQAFVFNNGATFSELNYVNYFYIFKLNKTTRRLSRCIYKWNPAKIEWKPEEDKKIYNLSDLTKKEIKFVKNVSISEKKNFTIFSIVIYNPASMNNLQPDINRKKRKTNKIYNIKVYKWKMDGETIKEREKVPLYGKDEYFFDSSGMQDIIDDIFVYIPYTETDFIEFILPYELLAYNTDKFELKKTSQSGIPVEHRYKTMKRLVSRFFINQDTNQIDNDWKKNWKILKGNYHNRLITLQWIDSLTPYAKDKIQNICVNNQHLLIKSITKNCCSNFSELAKVLYDYNIPLVIGCGNCNDVPFPLFEEAIKKILTQEQLVTFDYIPEKIYNWRMQNQFIDFLLIWDNPERRINNAPLSNHI